MNTGLEMRYIPAWLGDVVSYYKAGYDEFNRIVSKHDLNLYHLANNLFLVKLQTMQIASDFIMPDATVQESFSTDDAVFALYGPRNTDKVVAQFNPTKFQIFTDKRDGIILVEDPKMQERDLAEELTKAIALYKGKDQAYASACFKRYLSKVNNYLNAA